MAEHTFEKIKTGGLFSPKIKVIYETKVVRMLTGGEVNSTVLYTEDLKRLGYCEFAYQGREGKVNTLTIDDWSIEAYAEGLLRQIVSVMKKKGVKTITAELYASDNTYKKKITAFKKTKFKGTSGGAVTGYNRYLLKRNL